MTSTKSVNKAHRTGNAGTIAAVARIVVVADFLFTATAVLMQAITGVALAWNVGYALNQGWIVLSLVLYVVTGLFWLPVVWMPVKMRELARTADARKQPLPRQYHRLFRTWFVFSFPAFASVAGIPWLMIARPEISFVD